jgi:CubicO group peptidase (beta-lactamase class C family)
VRVFMTARRSVILWPGLVVVVLVADCQRATPVPEPAPASPASSLEPVLARWDHDEHPDLRAVIVRRDGAIIAERYYHGEQPDTLHDVRSAGKSITSLLVGIAIDRGEIAGTAVRLPALLPGAQASAIAGASLDDLLTMRSGLDADDQDDASPGNEDKLDAAADPVAFALSAPARPGVRPGERYLYNSLTAYLVGLIVEHAAGRHLDELAREALFAPLGTTTWTWQRDAAGHTKGQGNLALTARDFAKLGELVLRGGTFEGRRVISERWIRDSLAPHVRIADADPYADGYGYFWYSRTHRVHGRDVAVSFASGNGGNKIYVVPALDLVVAITSSPTTAATASAAHKRSCSRSSTPCSGRRRGVATARAPGDANIEAGSAYQDGACRSGRARPAPEPGEEVSAGRRDGPYASQLGRRARPTTRTRPSWDAEPATISSST